jgi:hypothetical protein
MSWRRGPSDWVIRAGNLLVLQLSSKPKSNVKKPPTQTNPKKTAPTANQDGHIIQVQHKNYHSFISKT